MLRLGLVAVATLQHVLDRLHGDVQPLDRRHDPLIELELLAIEFLLLAVDRLLFGGKLSQRLQQLLHLVLRHRLIFSSG